MEPLDEAGFLGLVPVLEWMVPLVGLLSCLTESVDLVSMNVEEEDGSTGRSGPLPAIPTVVRDGEAETRGSGRSTNASRTRI